MRLLLSSMVVIIVILIVGIYVVGSSCRFFQGCCGGLHVGISIHWGIIVIILLAGDVFVSARRFVADVR